jgi:hypothetical protein
LGKSQATSALLRRLDNSNIPVLKAKYVFTLTKAAPRTELLAEKEPEGATAVHKARPPNQNQIKAFIARQ